MSPSEPIDFVPDEISILDWYDGVIRGIARSQGEDYLFIMAAWDLVSGRKAYVMVNLDPAIAIEMKQLCQWKLGDDPDEEKWNRFDQIYDQYLTNYEGSAYLLSEAPIVSKTLTITATTADHLDELRDYDIEKTMDLNAHKLWFGKQ
jgi:hypothetical protein